VCALYGFGKRVFKPGQVVPVVTTSGVVSLPWAGFARAEILEWWQGKGGVLVDIHADRFAERSDQTRKLAWCDMEPGTVIRGVIDSQTKTALLKVVTRGSTAEELLRYEHPRMPLVCPPLFPGVKVPLAPDQSEPDLFSS
jgi:hypothetical protein